MRIASGIVTALALIVVLYFVIVGTLHLFWGIGGLLIALLVLAFVLDALDIRYIGGLILFVLVALVVFEIFFN